MNKIFKFAKHIESSIIPFIILILIRFVKVAVVKGWHKMRNSGYGRFNGLKINRRNLADYDWETSNEIAPDPFSEEEHTRTHSRRFTEIKGNKRKQERLRKN